MNCLVTGSSGFVGKRLVVALRQKGFFVKEFDHSGKKNVLDNAQLKREMKGIDIVFHLAGVLDEDSPNLFEVNVQGTKNCVEAAAQNQVKQFVFTSSVGVMGDIKKIADEQTPLAPVTPYEKSKAEAEQIVLSYQEVLPVTIVRSALVLGPNRYWKKIIEMVEKNTPLAGDGKNKWQMVFIDDLVDALVFLAGKEEAFGETFIVAEQNAKTLEEIAEFVRKKKGVSGELKKVSPEIAKLGAGLKGIVSKLSGKKNFLSPQLIDRMTRTRLYSTKKINALGWKAKWGTFEALEKTMKELEK